MCIRLHRCAIIHHVYTAMESPKNVSENIHLKGCGTLEMERRLAPGGTKVHMVDFHSSEPVKVILLTVTVSEVHQD